MGEDWLAEHTLWTHWICRGELQVMSDCELIQVEARSFCERVKEDEAMQALMASYAEVFVEWLNDVGFSDLTDLFQVSTGHNSVEKFITEARILRETKEKEAMKENEERQASKSSNSKAGKQPS